MNNNIQTKDEIQDLKIIDLDKRLTKIERLLYGTMGQTFAILIIVLQGIL